MDLRVETPVVLPEGVAPKRVQAPENREELLLPLTLRERLCVAAMAEALKALELESVAQGRAVSDYVLIASKALLRTFADVSGVKWTEAKRFW